jgi:hypothetical protein
MVIYMTVSARVMVPGISGINRSKIIIGTHVDERVPFQDLQ